jgi:hypothetical protein
MAGMVAESLFADKLDTDLRKRLRQAMHQACTGNARREGDWHGDDMWPSYSNASLQSSGSADVAALVSALCLQCVCRGSHE